MLVLYATLRSNGTNIHFSQKYVFLGQIRPRGNQRVFRKKNCTCTRTDSHEFSRILTRLRHGRPSEASRACVYTHTHHSCVHIYLSWIKNAAFGRSCARGNDATPALRNFEQKQRFFYPRQRYPERDELVLNLVQESSGS
jgi:hypothetical protein